MITKEKEEEFFRVFKGPMFLLGSIKGYLIVDKLDKLLSINENNGLRKGKYKIEVVLYFPITMLMYVMLNLYMHC